MAGNENKYLFISFILHVSIFLVLILGFDFAPPMPVFENTNKNDVISAVVLGDTEKSKILTSQSSPAPQPEPVKEIEKKPAPKPSFARDDIVALKPAPKPKPKPVPKKNFFANDLLADIKKTNLKQKVKQKQLQSHFEQTIREQAEQSLRQQLLNENIKLQDALSREAQGRVDKYAALIIQTITQHWIIPAQSRQNLKGEIMIRLAPGGMVLDAQVTKSSGDPALDSSARAAVFKASPLPVPSDPKEFEAFRQFVIKFTPKDVLSNTNLVSMR